MERKYEIVFCYMNPWFSKIGVNRIQRDVSCCTGILGFRKSYTDFLNSLYDWVTMQSKGYWKIYYVVYSQ